MGGWNWVSGFSKKIPVFFPPPKNREKYYIEQERANLPVEQTSRGHQPWPQSLRENQRQSTNGNTKSYRLNDVLRMLSKDYLFGGEPDLWLIHKQKLQNLIWSNDLVREEAIKMINLSFTGNAIHLI